MYGKFISDVFDDEEPLLKTTNRNVNDTSEDVEQLNNIFNICTDIADIVHW